MGGGDEVLPGTRTARFPSIGAASFTDDVLQALRSKGDPPADAAVSEFFSTVAGDHPKLFRHLVATSTFNERDEDLPGVSAFLAAPDPWPAWTNADLVRRGQRFFCQWGLQLGTGLWMASLPADYACARGAEPLVRTARLTRNPKRRYVETGQMIIDAMTPGALEPGDLGYVTVRRVRLMHAAVRHVLLHVAEIEGAAEKGIVEWDDVLGVPINQEDLLGCLFSFSVVGIQTLQRSGIRVNDADAEAYIHAWNLIGHYVGIDANLLPLGWDDAQKVWQIIQQREYAPSEAGRELTAAAVECMQELLGSRLLQNIPAAGIRHYLGEETADLLGVPPARLTGRMFFGLSRLSAGTVNRTFLHLPGARTLTAWLGLRMLRSFEEFERDGNRPRFEISGELKQAWGI